ncbi:MAG TPA: AbiV family abortive infection protein [Flavobacteriales bacterium]|nr:AbiV family abortive infection protein [Flavobacteriales bacterium]HRE97976.1 AbiV family abortive infection protein [Flavobacteriales bacterium]
MKKEPDFYSGFSIALENSKTHFKGAEMLAREKLFGLANSHLILAAEEGIKAYMLFAKHFDKDLLVEDFDQYFQKHKFKHENIKGIQFFLSLMKNMLEITFGRVKSAILKGEDRPSIEELRGHQKDGIQDLIGWLKGDPKIEFNEEWWNQADNMKNKGFYVGFNKGNAQWESPDKVDEKQYKKSYKIVNEFLDLVYNMEVYAKDPEAIKIYEEMKNKSATDDEKTNLN